MKKLIGLITILLSLTLIAGCKKEKTISAQDLPTEIKTYITTHFPNSSITKAVKIKGESEMYEITLSDGFELEFNKNNEIIDIDGKSKLPDSVIPSDLLSYVDSNYSSNYIVGWEIQANKQEVELNNKVVLLFTMSHQFIGIDD